MQLILCAVTLGLVAVLFGSAEAGERNLCNTSGLDKATYSDVYELDSPKTKDGKCIYECMLRVSGMTDDNGLINVSKFMDFLTKSKSSADVQLKTMRTVTEACKNHKHLSENKCETAGLFVQCVAEEGGKKGLGSTLMRNAIHGAYHRV